MFRIVLLTALGLTFVPPAAMPLFADAATLLQSGQAVGGTVVDEEGTPVAGASVSLRIPSQPDRTTQTDAEGGFAFDNVAGADVTVTVTVEPFEPITVAVTDNVPLRIALPRRQDASRPMSVNETVTVIGSLDDARLTTGSAFVVTQQELEKFEFTNVHHVLRRVPGVYLREEDGLGTFPRIGIRASSSGRSDRISVLEDGIPAAMAPYANTSAYYFPNIGRMSTVEVLKGPEILRYGPQTTSGAINLLSTEIPSGTEGFGNIEFGDFSSRKIHANYGTTIGQLGVLVETYQKESDGFHRLDRSSRTGGHDIAEYLGKMRWRSSAGAGLGQQLDLKLFYGDEYADVSYLGLTDADFRRDPNRRYGLSELERMNRGRKTATLQHRLTFTPRVSLTSTGYWNKTHRDYTRLNQINGINIADTGITSQINNGGANAALLQGILDGTADTTHPNGVRYGNNFQTFVSRGAQVELNSHVGTGHIRHELIAGVRVHQDDAKNTATISNVMYAQIDGGLVPRGGTPSTPNEGYARAVSVWIADRVTAGRLTLLPLVRYEDINSVANIAQPSGNRNSLEKWTAGVGANVALSAQWAVLAGVHQGFAPPGSGVAMGTRGEESTNYEGGIRYRRGTTSVDAISFYSDYSNALRNCLVANPCGGGVIDGTEQSGAKQVYGLEFAATTDVFAGSPVRVPVRFAYTYTSGEYTHASDIPTGVRQGDVLDLTPKNILSLQLGLEANRGLSFYTQFNYTDGACINSTCGRPGVDPRFLHTEDLFTVDVSVSHPLTSTVAVYVRGENVFDQRRITHRGADGARGNAARYVGAGLRVGF